MGPLADPLTADKYRPAGERTRVRCVRDGGDEQTQTIMLSMAGVRNGLVACAPHKLTPTNSCEQKENTLLFCSNF